MNEKILLIANCIGIGASIFGFVLLLWHLWKGVPVDPQQRQSQVKKTVLMAIIFVFLLTVLSLRLKNVVETYKQVGSFEGYHSGTNEIYYPVHYKFPPKLEFIRGNALRWGSPIILEQRKDGFKIILNDYSSEFRWIAVGTKSE